ncbi:MAG: hypothetical protein KBC33_02910 [Candidatus Pacebacteria bacterium]|nr:hypothetical protein [Candidatus Paceibacterota bacterium]
MARKAAGASSKKRPVVMQAAPVESEQAEVPGAAFIEKIIDDGVVSGNNLRVWIPLVGGGNKRIELSAVDMTKVPDLLYAALRGLKGIAAVPATA